MLGNIDKILNVGVGVISLLGAYGIISAIKEGTFLKYPYRMHLTHKEIAKGKLLKDMLKEEADNKKENIK